MFRIPQFCCSSVIRRIIITGVLTAFIAPQVAIADDDSDSDWFERHVKKQLKAIRKDLDNMEARLAGQMQGMQGDLDATLDQMQTDIDSAHGKLDLLQLGSDDIYHAVTAVYMDIKTELCLDESVMAALDGGAHGEFGVGWPNVLDAKAILQGQAGFGVEVAVGNEICIEIPLYSVESNDFLLKAADFQSPEFDAMLGTIAGGARVVVPFWASVYDELMPTPEQALQALDNYIGAATGSHLDGSASTYGPEFLLAPDILLDPVVPQIFKEFVAEIPGMVNDLIDDPCWGLENSPLGKIIDKNDATYKWFCTTTSNGLQLAVNGIGLVVNAIKTIVNPIRLFLGLPPI